MIRKLEIAHHQWHQPNRELEDGSLRRFAHGHVLQTDISHQTSSHAESFRHILLGQSRIAIVLMILLGTVKSERLYPVSTNTGTGLPTTALSDPSSESKYFTYATGLTAFAYMCNAAVTVSVSDCIKLFRYDGTLIAQSATQPATYPVNKMSLQLKDPMKVIYASVTSKAWMLTLTESLGVYAFSLDQTYTGGASQYFTASWYDHGTAYMYTAGHSGDRKIYKLDTTGPITLTQASPVIVGVDYGRVLLPLQTGHDTLLHAGKGKWFIFVSKTTMTSVTAISPIPSPTPAETRSGKIENMATNDYFYEVSLDGKIYKYDLANVIANIATLTASAFYDTTYTTGQGTKLFTIQILDISSHRYLALSKDIDNKLQLINRNTMALVSTVQFQDSRATSYVSLVRPYLEPVSNRLYFSRLENTNKNFQSYYLLFDNCTYRGSNDVCTTCLTGYYRFSTLPADDCVLPADFLPAHGINSLQLLMSPCSTAGCASCLLNYQTCTHCDAPSGYYMKADLLCYTKAQFAVAEGVSLLNASAGVVLPCVAANCLQCIDDYALCDVCDTVSRYSLVVSTRTCVLLPNVPSGYGLDTVGLAVLPCKDVNCKICTANYQTCTECDQANGYTPDAGKCVQNEYISLTSASYRPSTGMATFALDSSIIHIDARDMQIAVVDSSDGRSMMCDSYAWSLAVVDNVIVLSLRFDSEILSGTVSIQKISKDIVSLDNKKRIKDYPLRKENIYFAGKNRGKMQKAEEITLLTVSNTKAVLNILAIGVNPGASVLLDKIVSDFVYLELLSGPFMAYPDYIFKSVRELRLVPISIFDKFDSWNDNQCLPPGNYLMSEYACNYFYNYGEDNIWLMITLAINIVISLTIFSIQYLIYRRKPSQSYNQLSQPAKAIKSTFKQNINTPNHKPADGITFKSALEWIKDSYGIKFFVAHTRGECLKLLYFSILNLSVSPSTRTLGMGIAISLMWLVFYLAKIAIIFFIVRMIIKSSVKQDISPVSVHPGTDSPESISRTPEHTSGKFVIGHPVKLKNTKFWFMEFYFEDMNIESSKLQMCYPAIDLIRCLLLSIVVRIFADIPLAQHSVAAFLEVVYFVYLLKSNVKVSKWETRLEAILQIFHIA